MESGQRVPAGRDRGGKTVRRIVRGIRRDGPHHRLRRSAGVHHLARAGDAAADRRHQMIVPGDRHRGSAEPLEAGRRSLDPPPRAAGRQQFREQRGRKPGPLDHVGPPAAGEDRERARSRRQRTLGCRGSGEAVGDPFGNAQHARRAAQVRLGPHQEAQCDDGRNRLCVEAGDVADRLARQRGLHLRHVGLGAVVIPRDRWTERLAAGADQDCRLSHARDPNACDHTSGSGRQQRRERPLDAGAEVGRPGLGARLARCPDRRLRGVRQFGAVEVDHPGLDPGGADVDADQQWPSRAHAEPSPSCQGRARPLIVAIDRSRRARPVLARNCLRSAPSSATASFQ